MIVILLKKNQSKHLSVEKERIRDNILNRKAYIAYDTSEAINYFSMCYIITNRNIIRN